MSRKEKSVVKRIQFIFIVGLLSVGFIFPDECFKSRYATLLSQQNYNEIEILLEEWTNSFPDDAELFIAYCNYYLSKGRTTIKTKGSMGSGMYGIKDKNYYDYELTNVALSYLDKALILYPDRLDIHFGKANVLSQTLCFEELTKEIKVFLKRSQINQNNWYWSDNLSFFDAGLVGEEIIFSGLNDYMSIMYNYFDQNKYLLNEIIKLYSEYFPNNVIGLNLAAWYYSLDGDVNKTIETLLLAYSIDSTDYIIIGNLARAYEENNENIEALKFYNLMLNIDNDEAKKYAQEGINRIQM